MVPSTRIAIGDTFGRVCAIPRLVYVSNVMMLLLAVVPVS